MATRRANASLDATSRKSAFRQRHDFRVSCCGESDIPFDLFFAIVSFLLGGDATVVSINDVVAH